MRTPSRYAAIALAAAAIVAAPSAASAVPDRSTSSVQPTSRGEAVVGFVASLPAGLRAGGTLRGFEVVRVDSGGAFAVVKATDVAEVQRAMAGLPGLRYVEDNVTKYALVTPNDSQYGSQYGPNMMGAPTAWGQVGYGSSSVVVSVIDTGIRRTHQDFNASRVLAGYDYHNGDSNPADDCDHGTHTAGTVAATTNNGIGVAGMSQATILPYKVLSAPDILGRCSGSAANIASAIRAAADNGAKVISMSIGGPDATVERDAVQYAYSKGVILVAAAGNDGGSNSIDYPGAYPEVIAVAALESNKARASYSDGGPQLDIAAPGSNVLSTIDNSDSAYGTMSGTSMATPHVAGAIALALGCAPAGTTRATIVNTLYSTAEDLGAAGRDDLYGHGLARVDRLVANVCTGGGGPTNNPPTASFTTSASGLTASVNGSGSADPDGDPLTYAWTWGDGGTSTGVTASHTYAAAGTYTVGLTVSDGRGGSNSTTRTVTVSPTGDPDPSTPNLTSGQQINVTLSGTGDEKFFKIAVPAGKSQLQVVMTGPACGLLGCAFDADLYTRVSARPNDTTYTCRPFAGGSNETCTHASPAAAYWYIRVDAYTGSGTVTLKATVS
ncbi:MAG TPA: S8 family serine peptidase [Frankiaceae bacterium]|nr:S8 family serine peptidase [Frankiaceae bacterium]